MKQEQVLQKILDTFKTNTFKVHELHEVVTQDPARSHVGECTVYQHVLRLLDRGIVDRIARGHYALTQKGMAIHLQSKRDKIAHAFLQEILNQKAEQDLIHFEITQLKDKLNDLQNRSYEADSKIDTFTTQLLNTIEESN